jgi:hypothetical protein
MYNLFPYEIINIILDFSDYNTYWKLRFTNDVLPKINNYFKWVGIDCNIHDNLCTCIKKNYCHYCYLFDECYYHYQYDYISFYNIKDICYKRINYRYMPIETFLYLFDRYENADRYINYIKAQLEYYIINKKYILKHI